MTRPDILSTTIFHRGTMARIAALVAVLTLACFASAFAAEEVMTDGVLHVINGAEPLHGVETMELEELWRIGGDDEDSVLLGTVSQALVDGDNSIYLLDAQLSHVEVFSAEGEHIRTLGREGSGPGEFAGGFDMLFMPDGSLGVVQSFPGKIIKLNLDGTPAGVYMPDTGGAQAGGFLVLVNVLGSGEDLILTGMKIAIDQTAGTQTRSYFIRRFGEDQKQIQDLLTEDRVWDFTDFTYRESESDWVWSRITRDEAGRIAVGIPRDEYEITLYDAQGEIDRVITREYESWSRSEKASKRMEAFTLSLMNQFPPNTPWEISDVEADIMGLTLREDGSIWSLSSRGMWEAGPDVLHRYDVFSRDGVFEKQVDVICEGTGDMDLLVFATNGLVFQVTGFHESILAMQAGGAGSEDDEAEPMEVICYRIK